MRVSHYAKDIGRDAGEVMEAIKQVNLGLPGDDQISARSPSAQINAREMGLITEYFQSGQDEVDLVDAEFFEEADLIDPDGAKEQPDPVAESDAVDAIFKIDQRDGIPGLAKKVIPMRKYALWGRRLKGDSVSEIKVLQDANDESQAINLACSRLGVDAGDYKFHVKFVKDLPPRIGRGTPRPEPDQLVSV